MREALLFCKACLAQLDRASDSNAWNLKAVSSTLMVGLFLPQMCMYMGFTMRRLFTIHLQISISYQSNKLQQTWINTKHLCGVREAFSFSKACLAQLDRASDSNACNLKAVSSTLTVGFFFHKCIGSNIVSRDNVSPQQTSKDTSLIPWGTSRTTRHKESSASDAFFCKKMVTTITLHTRSVSKVMKVDNRE